VVTNVANPTTTPRLPSIPSETGPMKTPKAGTAAISEEEVNLAGRVRTQEIKPFLLEWTQSSEGKLYSLILLNQNLLHKIFCTKMISHSCLVILKMHYHSTFAGCR